MATVTLLQKSSAKKMSVEIDLNQWEKLADVFGFYNPHFIRLYAPRNSNRIMRKCGVFGLTEITELNFASPMRRVLTFYLSAIGKIFIVDISSSISPELVEGRCSHLQQGTVGGRDTTTI